MPKGWPNEPARHGLAAKGIKTVENLATKITLRHSSEFLNVSNYPSFQLPDTIEEANKFENRLAKSPIREIPIKEIWTWQDKFNPEVVEWYTRPTANIEPIWAIYNPTTNRYWVYDGTHRTIAAKILKRRFIEARVVTAAEVSP